jgi:hypothetical protein
MALAILVILVLTIVGLAVAYFTQTEDRISGNARLVKAALYAADTGLRSGENLIGLASNSGVNITTMITPLPGDTVLTLPSGATAVPLRYNSITYGGKQSDGTPILILAPTPSGSREVTYYALYVRNNDEDPGGATINTDQLINLVAVGMVYAPGADLKAARPLAVKILEEQLMLSAQGNEFGAQKGSNQGGTGSGTKG